MPGVPQRASHDYVRNGTTALYAALDVCSGQVRRRSLHETWYLTLRCRPRFLGRDRSALAEERRTTRP